MLETKLNYRNFIFSELTRRQKRNPAYTLRAFARDLKIEASRLSEILNGKAGVSTERALGFAKLMALPEKEEIIFLDLVEMEHGRSKLSKKLAKERVEKKLLQWREVSDETFSSFSEWYYIPLVVLLGTPLESYTPAYIGKRLGITEAEAEKALETLLTLKLVEQKGEVIIPFESFAKTQVGSSAVRRRYLQQLMKKAEVALETQPLEKRSFSSTIIAVDPSQVQLVQERIRDFRRELAKELENGPKKESIYCLSLNFFEITSN